MKKLLLAASLLAAGIAPAISADMPVKARPPVAAPWSFSGCYVGSYVAGAFGRSTTNSADTTAPAFVGLPVTNNINPTGYLSGADVGCNYQAGQFVIGVEGDWGYGNVGASAFSVAPFNVNYREDLREKWMGTARGRLGIVVYDKLLLFATGGGAWARMDLTDGLATGAPSNTDSQTFSGWTAGGGFELGLPQWQPLLNIFGPGRATFRADYLYADFGNKTFAPLNCGCVVQTIRAQQHTVRFGLNYLFDWTGPVVARY